MDRQVTESGKEIRNGEIRPEASTKTGRVWAIADRLTRETGLTAKRSEVLSAAEKQDINIVTASNQFTRWRKFHSITARRSA